VKKLPVVWFSITLITLSGRVGAQQCTSAGDRSLAYYHDIVPDTTLTATTSNGTWIYPLDINGDGIVDFEVTFMRQLTGWHSEAYQYIQALGDNRVLANTTDVLMLDSLSFGEQICETGEWRTTAHFHHFDSWSGGGIDTGWPDSGMDKYVGLKLVSGGHVAYGWVKVFYAYSIRVEEYSCGAFPVPDPPIGIYPNPTNDHIFIYSGEKSNRVQLYNNQGQLVLERTGDIRFLDLYNFAAGTYIIKIETASGVTAERIVLTNKPK
jgi:hypothetical protein